MLFECQMCSVKRVTNPDMGTGKKQVVLNFQAQIELAVLSTGLQVCFLTEKPCQGDLETEERNKECRDNCISFLILMGMHCAF